MRLDHVSYVTTHEQLADKVQRLGSLIGSTFVDGGIHPRFGTRNFTCALMNHQYIEVVCPLDHPATEQSPWGKAVTKKAINGGGWFTWVFSVEDISMVEEKFGRKSVEGHRTRPDGTQLKWRQIGVKEIEESRTLPFFIEWLTNHHPSEQSFSLSKISQIVISDYHQLTNSMFQNEIIGSLGEVNIQWEDPNTNDFEIGITEVHIETASGIVVLN